MLDDNCRDGLAFDDPSNKVHAIFQWQIDELRQIIDYLYKDEENDFKARGRPEDHIFQSIRLVDLYLKEKNE